MRLSHARSIGDTWSPPLDLRSTIRAEYEDLPGLSLTLAQAARLWNVDRRDCLEALELLTREGFLSRAKGLYVRARTDRLPG
jgi:hypothetical protein